MRDENHSSLDPEKVLSEIRAAVERIRKKASEPIQQIDPEAAQQPEADLPVAHSNSE